MGVKELYNEAELLNQVAEGNARAFQILFNSYRNKVFNYAFKLLRSQAAAEEVTQDVFVQIWILTTQAYNTIPSKASAYGELARCYLYMNDYANAALYADSALAIRSTLNDLSNLTTVTTAN